MYYNLFEIHLNVNLYFKTRQVEDLQRAHDSRLERLNNLQASYKLAREEIKTYEFGK